MKNPETERIIDRCCLIIAKDYIEGMNSRVTRTAFKQELKDMLLERRLFSRAEIASLFKEQWVKDIIISYIEYIKEEVEERELECEW